MQNTLRLLKASFIAILALGFQVASYGEDQAAFEQRGTYMARQWVDAFKKLNTRNNITMILSNRNSFYELENVVSVEPNGHFLIVRCEPSANAYFYSLVYPDTIMLVREFPRTGKEKQVDSNVQKWPNKASEPTPMSVTPAAGAPVAPATGAAHL